MERTPRGMPPGRGRRLGMPVSAWPAPDRQAWLIEGDPDDLDTPPGTADQAKNTRKNRETAYAHWLLWLRQHQPASLDLPPAERVRQDWVLAYLEDLRGRFQRRTVLCYACALKAMFAILAPDQTLAWFNPILNRLERQIARQPAKPRDIIEIDRLFEYGIGVMDDVIADTTRSPVAAAVRFSEGLLFAMLAARPLRRAAMAALRIGEEFLADGDGFRIRISGADAKNGEALEFPAPARLVPYLRVYLDRHRPILTEGQWYQGASSLWLSEFGTTLSGDMIMKITTRHGLEGFGRAITPHEFRHCAASSIVRDHPEDWPIIRAILGHKCLRTAEKFYIHTRQDAAAKRYQHIVRQRRREAELAFSNSSGAE